MRAADGKGIILTPFPCAVQTLLVLVAKAAVPEPKLQIRDS